MNNIQVLGTPDVEKNRRGIMTKTKWIKLAQVSMLALTLCGVAALAGAPAEAKDVKKLAILTPEDPTDFGWNQQGFDAAKAVAEKMGIEFMPATGLGYGDVHPTLRELADDGASLMIAGAAGIGKSRLVGEFLQSPALAGWSVLQWPQSPERRLGTADELDALAEQLARSAGHPAAVCQAAEDASGGLARAALEACYRLPVADPMWSGLDPAQRRAFLFEGLVAAIGELSRSRPTVLVVEDAHWADADAVRLLRELYAGLDDTHTLVVTTWRDGFDDGSAAVDEESGGLRLDRLADDDVRLYLDHWLGAAVELSGVKEHVAGKSEGVPLYLEESLRCLETDGIIGGEPGAYRLLNPDRPIRLAPNVRGLIESRIGALSAADQRILAHAAVVGPSFHLPVLHGLSPGRADAVRGALGRLTAGGFLAEAKDERAVDGAFRHGLYQEVAYAMLPHKKRRVLHTRVLATMRRSVAKNLPGRVEQLARHAQRAEDWGPAYAFSRAAGRSAERRCQHAAAVELYADGREALDRLPPTRRHAQRRIDLLIAQPLALLPQGGRGADDLLERARGLAGSIGDFRRRAVASSILGSYQWAYGDIDDAISLASQALDGLAQSLQKAAEIPVRIRL
ncbi:AAA family ATPase, partial [bacterium]|nr:AAA family ATPase [bacterium]